MKRSVIICIALLLALSACNTIQGIGLDMRSAGEGVAETAQKAKSKISGNGNQSQ